MDVSDLLRSLFEEQVRLKETLRSLNERVTLLENQSSEDHSRPEEKATVLFLPPELLLEIFRLAAVPSLSSQFYNCRQKSLASFALVHPSWQPVAHELLFEEKDIDADRMSVTTFAAQWKKAQIRGSTKRLNVEGNLKRLANETKTLKGYFDIDIMRWEILVELRWCRGRMRIRDAVSIVEFTRLQSLEKLEISDNSLAVSSAGTNLRFPRLSSLVLASTRIVGDISDCQNIFNSTSMPNLAHLSIKLWDTTPSPTYEMFRHVLPQLKSLAIDSRVYELEEHKTLLRNVHTFPKLVHLSICRAGANGSFYQNLFPPEAVRFNLDSLHLFLDYTFPHSPTSSGLATIVKGEKEGFRIGKVLLYGPTVPSWRQDCFTYFNKNEDGERISPPFLSFIGT